MAYTDIDKPSDYFNTKLYTGNGSTSRSITGVGFQPDWVWVKSRSATYYHGLWDAVRTNKSALYSNVANAEDTSTGGTLGSLDSDGFTTQNVSGGFINNNGTTYASWNWKAGGSASSNSNGSITSSISASSNSGFSIVSYSGTSSNGTIGHGLDSAPKMVIVKALASGRDWMTYHKSVGATKYLFLNATDASASSSGIWNDTDPTSTVVHLGSSNSVNGNGINYIAYCFAEKQGYSKISSFVGNGNASGTYVHLGFSPSFVLYKVSSAASDWYIQDNKRLTYNVNNTRLEANNSDAEVTGAADSIDMLSNGFKLRHTSSSFNASGATYIFMAFASNPLVTSTGVPATAR